MYVYRPRFQPMVNLHGKESATQFGVALEYSFPLLSHSTCKYTYSRSL